VINYTRLSLYCLLGAVFLAPIVGGRFDLTANALVYMLILFSFLLLRMPGANEEPAGYTPERWAQIVFLLLAVAAGLTTVGRQASLIQLFAFATFYLIFLGGVRLAGMRREWMPAVAIAAAGAILGVAAIGEYQLMRAAYLKFAGSEYRVFGSFYGLPGFFNPGFFAGFLAMSLPITLGVYCGSRKRWLTVAAGLAWELQLSALLLTGTRFGAMAALLAVACFAVLLLAGKSFSRTTLARLAILVAIALAPIVLFHAPMFSRVAATQEQSHSMAFRILTWKAALNVIGDHPLLGVGPGAFQLIFPRYAIAGFTRLAHQSYLQIAAEAGIPCLVALLSGIVLSMHAALRGLRRWASETIADTPVSTVPILCGFIAATVGSLVRNVTDSDWYVPGIGIVFWLALGVASGIGRRLSDEAPKPAAARWPRLVGMAAMVILVAAIGVSDMAAYHADSADANREHYPDEALSEAQKAASLAPLSAQYQIRFAGAILATDEEISAGPVYDAMSHARRAAQLEPTSPTPHMLLGQLYTMLRNPIAALAEYREAEKRDPNSPSIKIAAADTFRSLGMRDQELEVYRAMLKVEKSPYEQVRAIPELVDVNYAYAHLELGKSYEEQGNTRLAAGEYRAVIERIDRRNKFKFMITQDRAAGGAPREDDARVQDTYTKAREGLVRLREAGYGRDGRDTGRVQLP
jgi:putative inorganic carbon (HCO3(-)) transporter